jgi:hypothetical protein
MSREKIGKNITPKSVMEKNWREAKERYEIESKRLKSLKLGPSRETEYDRELRMYVPRARLVGSDGVVRTRRTRNEEPAKIPKESEYNRLYSAFASIRKKGINAKWNVLGQTYLDYYGELPLENPGLFHWKADGSHNDPIGTGMEWTREWECVQDAVSLDAVCGSVDTSMEILDSYGFKTIIDSYDDGNNEHIRLVFRGSGKVCSDAWDWVGNCMSENPTEPPQIN